MGWRSWPGCCTRTGCRRRTDRPRRCGGLRQHERGEERAMTPVVQWLLLLNIGVHILLGYNPLLRIDLAFIPALVVSRPWTLITYMVVHGSFWHLLVNMLGLFVFGPRAEERLGSRAVLGLHPGAGGIPAVDADHLHVRPRLVLAPADEHAGAVLLRPPCGGAPRQPRVPRALPRQRAGRCAVLPVHAVRGRDRRVGRGVRRHAGVRDVLAPRADPTVGRRARSRAPAGDRHGRSLAVLRAQRRRRRGRALRPPRRLRWRLLLRAAAPQAGMAADRTRRQADDGGALRGRAA